MGEVIRRQQKRHHTYFVLFGAISLFLLLFYFSFTIIHETQPQQFPINSIWRFPLSLAILPAEIFSFLFALYFVYCLLIDAKKTPPPALLSHKKNLAIAVLLPMYNEPEHIAERTIEHCKKLRWPGEVRIYLLDDSTQEKHVAIMKRLAKKYGANVIRREGREGYKAGNINNAVKNHITEEYFAVFDADQAPDPDFFEKTMDHFSDSSVGFVQTPQHFIDEKTLVERGAKIGSNIFYQAQCRAKAYDNALPFCGTNLVVRTQAFRSVHGFSYYTATEDLELGLRLSEAGWKGAYVPEIVVNGYAPPDITAYKSQQYRWANGNLAVLRQSFFRILAGRFTLRQQIHIFFTLGWWLIGVASLLYVIVPLVSLWVGVGTHHTWLPTSVIAILYANVAVGILLIYVSLSQRTQERVTFRDAFIQYSLLTNSMFIYTRAAINVLFGRFIGFITTNKTRSASSLRHVWLNLFVAAICFFSSLYALYKGLGIATIEAYRTYLSISIWLLFYAIVLTSSILFVQKNPEASAT